VATRSAVSGHAVTCSLCGTTINAGQLYLIEDETRRCVDVGACRERVAARQRAGPENTQSADPAL
jgi:hypothetical protein